MAEAAVRVYSALVTEGAAVASLRDLEFLYKVSRTLLKELEYGELLAELLDLTVQELGAERGFVLVLDGEKFRAAVARNYLAESLSRAEEKVSTTIASIVAEKSCTILLGDAQQDAFFRNQPSVHALGLRSVLCAPLVLSPEATALLYLENRKVTDCFNEHQRQLLDEVCKLSAPRLKAAVMIESGRRRAAELGAALGETEGILTADQGMFALLQSLRQLAPTDLPVLIEGETGTGKELIARAIYRQSKRNSGAFVVLNCAALPATLIESELFGYVRGAFTGANQDRMGYVTAAHRGTLFLDEIGELPLELQPQLLRVLQSGEFNRLGSVRSESADVRFIAATNRDLEREVDEGRFRRDLFYRISGITLKVPPLRSRTSDVPLLAAHFLAQYARRLGRNAPNISSAALEVLGAYSFPGNVRELESEMARLIAMSSPSATIQPQMLSDRVRGVSRSEGETKPLPAMSIAEMEKRLIFSVLEQTCGNRTRAAEILGLSREGLRIKLQKLNIRSNKVD